MTAKPKTDPRHVVRKVHAADRKLARHAAQAKGTLPVRAAAWVCEVADQPPLIALTGATALVGIAFGKPAVARAGIRMLASHLLATAVKTAIKRRIDRTRPHAAHSGDAYRLEPGGDHGHDLASFPSGHTAGAVAVVRALARDVPASAPLGAAAAAAVAGVQLPNAKHYASDVAAGAAIGLASEWIASTALDAAERRLRRITPVRP